MVCTHAAGMDIVEGTCLSCGDLIAELYPCNEPDCPGHP